MTILVFCLIPITYSVGHLIGYYTGWKAGGEEMQLRLENELQQRLIKTALRRETDNV